MASLFTPIWLRFAPTPNVRGFAVLAGFEAASRGILISVFPVMMLRYFGDAESVSMFYFLTGLLSLCAGLLVPYATRFIPRRFVFTFGVALMMVGNAMAVYDPERFVVIALPAQIVSVVVMFVCFNAYLLDYIERVKLGEAEMLRLLYSGLAWAIGPVLGVWLMSIWPPAPFLLSFLCNIGSGVMFWIMRLGDGKLIAKARRPAPNPLAYLPRFFAQPRLVAGWSFAVIRSCGWWVYVVYLPIYAVDRGLGEQTGGALLSTTNTFLFLAPLILSLMRRSSVRAVVRIGFLGASLSFAAAWAMAGFPIPALGLLVLASFFLIMLDVSAGLPFLMAVKPSERTEMSAIYSSYRDVSGVVTPGLVWVALLVAPLSGAFLLAWLGLLFGWNVAGALHPRLGRKKEAIPNVA
jgi:MFS family permease